MVVYLKLVSCEKLRPESLKRDKTMLSFTKIIETGEKMISCTKIIIISNVNRISFYCVSIKKICVTIYVMRLLLTEYV